MGNTERCHGVFYISALHRKQAISFEDADMATSCFSTLEALIECECRKGCIGILVA